MMRGAGLVVDDAMAAPGTIGGGCVLKYAGRCVSRDDKRCVRSFVGKHE